MPKLFYMQFVTSDWRRDLLGCSLAAKGAWIDLCAAMFDANQCGEVKGTLRDLSMRCGAHVEDFGPALFELQQKGIGDINPDLSIIAEGAVITINNRRMKREHDKKNKIKTENKPNKNQIKTQEKVNKNSSAEGHISNSKYKSSESDSESDARARRVGVLGRAWASAGLPPNGNAYELSLLADEIDGARQAAEDAGQEIPDDAAICRALKGITDGWKRNGLSPKMQPSKLATAVGQAIDIARAANVESLADKIARASGDA